MLLFAPAYTRWTRTEKEPVERISVFLCDDCLEKARRQGSPENSWLLKEVGLSK